MENIIIKISSKHKFVLEDIRKMIGRKRVLNDIDLNKAVCNIRHHMKADGIYNDNGLFVYAVELKDIGLINKNDYEKLSEHSKENIKYFPDSESIIDDLKLLNMRYKKIKHINATWEHALFKISCDIKKDNCDINVVKSSRIRFSTIPLITNVLNLFNK